MSFESGARGAEERGRVGGVSAVPLVNVIPMETIEKYHYFFPRLLFFGLGWGDLVCALRSMKTSAQHDWDEWHDRFTKLARSYEAAGVEAGARGKRATARAWLTKASVCYHFAEFAYFDNPAEKIRTQGEVARVFELARPDLTCPVEAMRIPHGGRELPAYLHRAGEGRRPCVILVSGPGFAKEVEMHTFAQAFVERGVSALVFDGPGQGVLAGTVPMALDFERVVGDVLGALHRHEAIDRDRIGIFGVTYGGYMAARAAAFHPREIKACVCVSGTYDVDNFPSMHVNVRKDFMYVFGVSNEDEMCRVAQSRMNLRDVPGITAPFLAVHGKEDRVFPYDSCLRLMRWAKGEKELIGYDGEGQAAINCFRDAVPRLSDWMAEKLA
ncbi:hypothetical protein BE20_44110 [Sorangium cellulosum]|nr:hypothetical protein BE20_44110 [Sorangium cellulosum]